MATKRTADETGLVPAGRGLSTARRYRNGLPSRSPMVGELPAARARKLASRHRATNGPGRSLRRDTERRASTRAAVCTSSMRLCPLLGSGRRGSCSRTGEQFTLPFEVAEAAHAPVIGAPAPRAESPLEGRTLGVDPICTQDPACPLHSQSIETITGAGTPTAIMFATPARCQTTYCGPVLNLLNDLVPEYRSRVAFGHVEIYRGPTGTGLSPTVDAWGLQSEPWLFTVDESGRIVRRLDGAFDRSEMRDALDELVA